MYPHIYVSNIYIHTHTYTHTLYVSNMHLYIHKYVSNVYNRFQICLRLYVSHPPTHIAMFIEYLSSTYYKSGEVLDIMKTKGDQKYTSVPSFMRESSE